MLRVLVQLSNQEVCRISVQVEKHYRCFTVASIDTSLKNASKKPHLSKTAHRELLEKFGREHLGVKELDDWYNVRATDVHRRFGFIRVRYGSFFNALKTLYPHHNWDLFRFTRVPKGYWKEDAQRDALERFGRERFGVKELDDWYSVPVEIVHNEFSFVRNYYKGSLLHVLKKLYPHHHWDPLRFSRTPHGYWTDENTQREALETLGREKLGVKKLDDWYNVSGSKVQRELGFISKYGSLFNALKKLYPKHEWDATRLARLPRADESSKREALEKFGRERFGVKELDDWYNVAFTDVHRELGFVKKYGTLFDALRALYPQHDWDPLRLSMVPRGYWQQPTTIQYYYNMFMNWKKNYGLKSVRDWHSLPPQQVKLFKRAAIGIFGSKMKLLEEWFPDVVWQWQYTSQLEFQCLLRDVIADANIKQYTFVNHVQNGSERHSTKVAKQKLDDVQSLVFNSLQLDSPTTLHNTLRV